MDMTGNHIQLPWINKIFQDECWYEGERRNKYVPPDDPVVINKVTVIIISGAGQEFRNRIRPH